MKRVCAVLLVMTFASAAKARALQPGGVQLLCHRTANQDVPENTLESLEQAALLGCNVVEIDLRRTLDGKIVMNHDGVLERLTDGVGEADKSYYDDLRLRDVGGWMGERDDWQKGGMGWGGSWTAGGGRLTAQKCRPENAVNTDTLL